MLKVFSSLVSQLKTDCQNCRQTDKKTNYDINTDTNVLNKKRGKNIKFCYLALKFFCDQHKKNIFKEFLFSINIEHF